MIAWWRCVVMWWRTAVPPAPWPASEMRTRPGRYILNDDHDAILVEDLVTWARWFEAADRTVAQDQIADAEVSTVFLGLDHAFGGGPPLLFETLVFGGVRDGECERYTTWAEALAGHAAMMGRMALGPQP